MGAIKKEENVLAKAAEKRRKKEKPGQPAMLTVGQVAPLLGVHANTVRRWSQLGILEYLRVGSLGHRRYFQEDLEHFLERQYTEEQ